MSDASNPGSKMGAVIELGANSVKFLVGTLLSDGRIKTKIYTRKITRLSEGLSKTGKLGDASIKRTADYVMECVNIARDQGITDILIFGTHPLRASDNSADFIALLNKMTGLQVQALTGQQEAFLSRKGVLLGIKRTKGTEPTIIDIGGGSTEIIHGVWAKSLPMGCVSLTESLLTVDPPAESDLVRIKARVRDALIRDITFINPGQRTDCIAVGGTAVSIAALSIGLRTFVSDKIHGTTVSREKLKLLITLLSNVTLDKRKELMKFDPDRADIIIAGAVILHAIFDYLSADQFMVSVYNIIHGIFHEYYSGTFRVGR